MSWKPEETVHGTLPNIRGKFQALAATDARIAQFDRHGNAMRNVQDPIDDNAAGEVVPAGSLPRPVAAKADDVRDADYGPLGRFEFKFT
jgi:hypothetical protein